MIQIIIEVNNDNTGWPLISMDIQENSSSRFKSGYKARTG